MIPSGSNSNDVPQGDWNISLALCAKAPADNSAVSKHGHAEVASGGNLLLSCEVPFQQEV